MTSTRVINQASSALALALFTAAGCNNIVGLDKITVGAARPADSAGTSGTDTGGAGSAGGVSGNAGSTSSGASGSATSPDAGGEGGTPNPGDCTTNQECTDRASVGETGAAGAGANVVAAVCVRQGASHCMQLLSDDCDHITGDYLNDQAIVIGSLFSTKGATAATNLPRQQSAELAVEQINAAGGVPSGSTSAHPRPLVLVSCDESTNLVRAAGHLVNDLDVPAIVGPNTSQDTLDVSTQVTVPGGTVVMSPTGVASSIAALTDNDLTWLMVPSDVQRAPLMISQINDLETAVKAAAPTPAPVKLGVVFRNDALGQGTQQSLNTLVFNGKSLADPINQNKNVQIDPYTATDPNQQAIVTKYLAFAPDIIVLAGTAEAVTQIMVPLEAQWTAANRPNYVLIDSTKVPELLAAVTNNDDLRMRIRGTGITPGPAGMGTPYETFTGFQIDYNVRFGTTATTSGMGPSHDAAYAIGLALAATTDLPVTGKSVAIGLRKLAGGTTKLEATAPNVLVAFQKLSAGQQVTEVGTFGMLDWDANGAVKGGTLEMWCVGGPSTKPAYQSSGLTFDIKSQQQSGAYVQCP